MKEAVSWSGKDLFLATGWKPIPLMKVAVSWSGGKDCLMALESVLRDPNLEVETLVTTVGEAYDRVSMHGVRRNLLLEQFQSLGIPGQVILIPAYAPRPSNGPLPSNGTVGFMDFPPNDTYVPAVKAALVDLKENRGVEGIVYGDIFLEDLRVWRDALLDEIGLTGIYPLWKQDTRALLRTFVESGNKATIVCLHHEKLDSAWAGRELDQVLNDPAFPAGLDPCGENGEFHTFVYDGPLFHSPVRFEYGETAIRGTYTFQDLLVTTREFS